MPKASNSRNGAEKQAKSAAVQPEINGAGVLTPQEAELIRGFVRALEHLEDEGREIGQNKSAIYKEAKLNQLSTWAIREVVKRRRQDPGVLELQDDLIKIYSDIAAGAKVRAAEPVARNEAAWQAGRADALAGHRDHAAGWRDKFGEVDYELGHQDGTELRQQAAEKLDRKPPPMASAPSIYEPVRKVARKRGTAEHLGDRQAASVKRAKRKGAQRPAA